MADSKRIGRIIGVMLLLQLVGLMVGFILLDALRSAGFAADSARIKAGVAVLLANGALTIGISIVAWNIFRQYSQQMAVWIIVLSVIMFIMQAVDTVYIMSMLALAEQPIGGGDAYNVLAASVRSTRRFAHYLELFAIDFWLLTFYGTLLRFAFIPRVVAGIGILTVLLQFFAVPLPGFLGYGINTNLGVPLAFGLLIVGLWSMARGFAFAEENAIAADSPA